MDFERLTSQMINNAQSIRALSEGVTDEQARYKPDPFSWSILEVINHLVDEENEDFCKFLEVVLHRPDQPRPKINPEAWVTERRYNERDLGESVQNYLAARQNSIAWLQSLAAPNWEATYDAPWGQIKAGDVLAAWAAHDLLHIRQLVELHWANILRHIEPYGAGYAGDW